MKSSLLSRVICSQILEKSFSRSLATAATATKTSGDEAKRQKLDRKVEHSSSFVLNLFRGELEPKEVFPYPVVLSNERRETLSMIIGPTEKFFQDVNDAFKNDEDAKIPKDVLGKFGELGALGAAVPQDYEGAALNNMQIARLAEIVGKNDLAIGVTMGAHQSIGYKGILLYGSEEQKAKYLPDLATGRKFASFCLTEPSSGSDANSIRTRAEKSADGSHYILNGGKIWISNGGFADVFTVFAQLPVKGRDGSIRDKVSAFVVERGYGGVTTGPPEKKMGIKGSNTAEVHFDNVKIPAENLLGNEGEGFKVAMNILNNGRFGIPASMTGAMKFCIQKTIEHITTRQQFGRKLQEYGLVQKTLAEMIVRHYVTESITYLLAANMDKGCMEYQLEAAIGKVYSSESAWWVCDEAIQLHGGMGFMRECGLERVLRDLRIFRIFEGANDVMRLFVALTGCQYAGSHLKEMMDKMKSFNVSVIMGETSKRIARLSGLSSNGPSIVSYVDPSLEESAKIASKAIGDFGSAVQNLLIKYRKDIIDQQYPLARLAEAAIDIYAMVAVLSRASFAIKENSPSMHHERAIVNLFCQQAKDRVETNLKAVDSKSSQIEAEAMTELARQICTHGSLIQQHPLAV